MQFGDIKIKQMQKIKYLGNFLTEGGTDWTINYQLESQCVIQNNGELDGLSPVC